MFEIVCVEVWHLRFGDLGKLCIGEVSYLLLMRELGTGLEIQLGLDEVGHRWLLRIEAEASIVVDIDDGREDGSHPILGRVVELLAEFSDLDSGWSEGSTDWRCWICLARLDLQFDHLGRSLCHMN